MNIKIIPQQVRDNLFICSSDVFSLLRQDKEPSEILKGNLFYTHTDVVEDKMLEDMTVMVPDRKYFDAKLDKALEDMKWFSNTYLKD